MKPISLDQILKETADAGQNWEAINESLRDLLLEPPQQLLTKIRTQLERRLAASKIALHVKEPDQRWRLLFQSSDGLRPNNTMPPENYLSVRESSADPEVLLTAEGARQQYEVHRGWVHHQLLLVSLLCRLSPPSGWLEPTTQERSIWQGLVGSRLLAQLNEVANSCRIAESVLILGETGTGKELTAAGLYRLWQCQGRFVAVNCAAIPENLIEAELFGVVQGAATGVNARKGRIEQADQGVLFLDEISEMPPHLQPKLLRVLQEKSFFPLGSETACSVNFRVVAASNRNLGELQGARLRSDLYYRISQAVINLLPLRQRSEDIPELCAHFVKDLERQFHKKINGFSPDAMERLQNYSWPGNIRELQNLLRFLYANTPANGTIANAQIPFTLPAKNQRQEGTLEAIVKSVEKEVIEKQLAEEQNVGRAARSLGLSEGYLYRKIKKLGIRLP